MIDVSVFYTDDSREFEVIYHTIKIRLTVVCFIEVLLSLTVRCSHCQKGCFIYLTVFS